MPSVLSSGSSGGPSEDRTGDPAAPFTETFARRPALPRRGLLPGRRVWATAVGAVALAVAGVLIVPLLGRIDLFSESPATSVRTVAEDAPEPGATASGSPGAPSAQPNRPASPGHSRPTGAAGSAGSGGQGTGGAGLLAPGTGTSGQQSGGGGQNHPAGTEHTAGATATATGKPAGGSGSSGGSGGSGSTGGSGGSGNPATVPGTGLIGSASGRCIDVTDATGGTAKDGTPLQIWNCDGMANQKWVFASDGSLRAMGLCMDVAWGSTANGAVIQLATCRGNGAQQFYLSGAGDLVNRQADKCVDVVDNGTGAGTRLQLWTCLGSANQKWHQG
ncbi:ricin-type beta-trefoil lectin domain protein [Streptomyces sp. NPDC058691]|uniref:ricin-type beta-trefoil lectin domain protein n=1 Tax=Streptomyces sp. NPDC058691 TaxID=3346601 RepID=UPI0036543557